MQLDFSAGPRLSDAITIDDLLFPILNRITPAVRANQEYNLYAYKDHVLTTLDNFHAEGYAREEWCYSEIVNLFVTHGVGERIGNTSIRFNQKLEELQYCGNIEDYIQFKENEIQARKTDSWIKGHPVLAAIGSGIISFIVGSVLTALFLLR